MHGLSSWGTKWRRNWRRGGKHIKKYFPPFIKKCDITRGQKQNTCAIVTPVRYSKTSCKRNVNLPRLISCNLSIVLHNQSLSLLAERGMKGREVIPMNNSRSQNLIKSFPLAINGRRFRMNAVNRKEVEDSAWSRYNPAQSERPGGEMFQFGKTKNESSIEPAPDETKNEYFVAGQLWEIFEI